MKNSIKKGVECYQCPGCISGVDTECYEKSVNSVACGKHRSGTAVSSIGKIFLGMPKGFDRLGIGLGGDPNIPVEMFESLDQCWKYDEFNIPVWKYLDKNGNTLVRGLKPRSNVPFLHVYLEDCLGKITCYEVSPKMVEEMD